MSLLIQKSAVMMESFQLYLSFFCVYISGTSKFKKDLRYNKNKLYEFYYLLHFNLWTFYLAMIIFYKDVAACFWNFLVLKGSLMGCNIISK